MDVIETKWIHILSTLICHVDQDCLGLSVGLQCVHPQLPAQPTLLGASEWTREMDGTDAVHTDYARVKSRAHSKRSVDVLRKHSGHQPVLACVGASKNLLFRLEFVDYGNRAEDLLLVD